MKRSQGFMLYLVILSVISGYLMSKASLVGRAGMSLFYREYNFLKTWWKGGLLVLFVLAALFMLHGLIQKRTPPQKGNIVHSILCATAITGLYFTYHDFRHTLSHHLLGERFHLGVYLYWIGWISICIYYMTGPQTKEIAPIKN